ncbi:MAG: hypothetical protein H5U20_03590 [Rhodobacteraceae bacterium]|nr:hypothetical protein [Paracoccaceae bacterium]
MHRKTGKREIACLMLAFLAGMFVWGVAVPAAMEAARYLTLPVFTFAGAAFGLDAWAKQLSEMGNADNR